MTCMVTLRPVSYKLFCSASFQTLFGFICHIWILFTINYSCPFLTFSCNYFYLYLIWLKFFIVWRAIFNISYNFNHSKFILVSEFCKSQSLRLLFEYQSILVLVFACLLLFAASVLLVPQQILVHFSWKHAINVKFFIYTNIYESMATTSM